MDGLSTRQHVCDSGQLVSCSDRKDGECCDNVDLQCILTFHQIFTRLPMPEAEFQNEQPVEMDFLVDAVMEPIPQQRSSFSESLIFVTICSRSLSQSVSTTSSMIRDVAQSGWDYSQDPLADEPPPRMHFLWHFDSPTAHTPDPMLILANVLAQVSVILLYRCFSESGLDNAVLSAEKRAEGRSRALAAADRIVDATAELPKLHYSRVRGTHAHELYWKH